MSLPIIHNDLQVGIGNGMVVIGINKSPIAMLSAGEAIMLASYLLKHASALLSNPDKKDSRELVPDESLGMNSEPPPASSGSELNSN